jgi:hypothetical protein
MTAIQMNAETLYNMSVIAEDETLLKRAGFALSDSNWLDLTIRYCIEQGIYDVMEVNELLHMFQQPVL